MFWFNSHDYLQEDYWPKLYLYWPIYYWPVDKDTIPSSSSRSWSVISDARLKVIEENTRIVDVLKE